MVYPLLKMKLLVGCLQRVSKTQPKFVLDQNHRLVHTTPQGLFLILRKVPFKEQIEINVNYDKYMIPVKRGSTKTTSIFCF